MNSERQRKTQVKMKVVKNPYFSALFPVLFRLTSPSSILVEDAEACFRRVETGKRVNPAFARTILKCGNLEDCERECAAEERFICEGFNYRIDPNGRHMGNCELLDQPFSRLNRYENIRPHPDYDYYAKDRNAGPMGCHSDDNRPPPPHRPPVPPPRRYPPPPPPNYDYDYDAPPPPRRNGFGAGPDDGMRRGQGVDDYYDDGGGAQGPSTSSFHYNSHLHHTKYFDEKRKPSVYWGRPPTAYLPPPPKRPEWMHRPQFHDDINTISLYRPQPPPKPIIYHIPHHHKKNHHFATTPFHDHNSVVLPSTTQSRLTTNDYLEQECSLRTEQMVRLHRNVIRHSTIVKDLSECEALCFKIRNFTCGAYAFRYSVNGSVPLHNCQLTDKNYKQLKFYTDVQPNPDFDIYTIHNRKACEKSADLKFVTTVTPSDERQLTFGKSECFWRVRSGHQMSPSKYRTLLIAKSIVDCQIECIRASLFTCRGFSYSYRQYSGGDGGVANCQLTDWSLTDLDPQNDLVPTVDFELYERASFGHGCEPNHFEVVNRGFAARNLDSRPKYDGDTTEMATDQLCYVGYGTLARLLPDSTRKSAHVHSEIECKLACSKYRQRGYFRCASFSFIKGGPAGAPNCLLSDVMQHDLLANVDYVPDPDAWLFAWDNYNPDCTDFQPDQRNGASNIDRYPNNNNAALFTHTSQFDVTSNGLDTWRVYSVNGLPCRRGTVCRQNAVAGFWYCDLEVDGGVANAWDYCCHPHHQCGHSEGYPYQWCYVGPDRTQWRRCSEYYYPYTYARGRDQRPDRPQATPTAPTTTLDEYEAQFDDEFLAATHQNMGAGRHWPLAYLHSEGPPTATPTATNRNLTHAKLDALDKLIAIIKSNELNSSKYQFFDTNTSDTLHDQNEVVLIRIPLQQIGMNQTKLDDKNVKFSMPNLISLALENPTFRISNNSVNPMNVSSISNINNSTRAVPIYRRSYITRTNITDHGKNRSIFIIGTDHSNQTKIVRKIS